MDGVMGLETAAAWEGLAMCVVHSCKQKQRQTSPYICTASKEGRPAKMSEKPAQGAARGDDVIRHSLDIRRNAYFYI